VIQINVIAGPSKGASFKPDEASFIIGRGRTNRIILLDNKVSARHAQIDCRGGEYVLRDLDSTNGTFVNGQAVQDVALKVGDEVRVGQTTLRVMAVSGGPPAQSAMVSIADADAEPAPVQVRFKREDRPLPEPSQLAQDVSAPGVVDAYRNLLAMYNVAGIIRSNADVDRMLDEVLDQIFRNIRAERAVVMVFDDETGELASRAFRSRTERPDEEEMVISRTIVNEVIDRQETVLTGDATLDERFNPAQSIVQQHIRSAMCAPLSAKNRALGIIYVDCRTEAGTFKKSDLELLTAIANEAGVAVENRILRDANLKAERLAAVGQTVAGLSHYIKNVLTCMEAGSEMVSMALTDGDLDAVRRGWGIVGRNERKISELVLDMLSYSTERRPARTACRLNDVAADVADMVKPAADAAAVGLVLELDPDLPDVRADAHGMHRCVLNLLTNALDAVEGREGASVRVSTGRDADRAVIAVADNGEGVPDELKSRIFDVFLTTKGERGTGLGLAVVKKIVNEHGGEISVARSAEGGAEFKISLPLDQTEIPAPNIQ